MHYSAYVPCFNNAATVRAAVESLFAQTLPPAELLVLDDGSTDASVAALAGLPVRLVRHERNLGRGAARARAMTEARHEFVLCGDATNVLAADFAALGFARLAEPRVAAVCGRIVPPPGKGAGDRWRNRHLFKDGQPGARLRSAAPLVTTGAILRRRAVDAAGGFDPRLRHSEDAELGVRLAAAGWDIVFDPAMRIVPIIHNTAGQVLERYWRWHAGKDEAVNWPGYARNLGYAFTMAGSDLRARDPAAAGLSLLCPHYCFWRSWGRRLHRRRAAG